MKTNSTISSAKLEKASWIRCEGKGNFNCSPLVKELAEQYISNGEMTVVIDLEICSGMDSTFMGNLAGIAMKLTKQGGKLEIVDAGEKNYNSLADLGLANMLNICGEDSEWHSKKEGIRAQLVEFCEDNNKKEKAEHVYESHVHLTKADDSNKEKFSTVLDYLEVELNAKKD